MRRKFVAKMDALWLVLLLIFSLLGWWQLLTVQKAAKEKVVAHVFLERTEVLRIPLVAGKEELFSVPQLPAVQIQRYDDGSLAISQSDCPDQICVRTGRLAYPGQAVACLPHRVFMRLELADASDDQEEAADVVVGGKDGQSK